MSKTELMFIDFKDLTWGKSHLTKQQRILEKFMGKDIEKGDRVLIKVHFGQIGNFAAFRPAMIRQIVEFVKDKGGIPTVAETTGLGYGFSGRFAGRTTATDYLGMAARQGFTEGTMDAPIIMLDGELGTDTIRTNVEGKYINRVEVARGMLHFDKIIMWTHAKGHPIGGIGGSIKNLGIGCVGKYSKGHAHFGDDPVKINDEKCKGEECGACAAKCPMRCITVKQDTIAIDHSLCIKCGHCSDTCKNLHGRKGNALTLGWVKDKDEQAVRFAENAKGVVDVLNNPKIPIYYFNVLIDVSPVCDCVDHTPYLMVEDIGILAGFDPLSIDQASVDLIDEAEPIKPSPIDSLKPGEDKLGHAHAIEEDGEEICSTTHISQLDAAERMGLGNREYSIKKIEIKDD